jgi:hypothetical protein
MIFGGIGVVLGIVLLFLELRSYYEVNDTAGLTVPSLLFIGVGLYYWFKKGPDDSSTDIPPEERYK